jgi:hypothetical protein
MKRMVLCCIALLMTAGLTGCISGAGVFNGLGNDPMAMIKITKSDYDPRTGENPIAYSQYLAVQDLAKALQIQIDWQTSSTAEAMASEFLPYGMAGAAGGAFTGLLYPFAGALTGPAAGVTGLVYGFGGAVNGAVTHSYSAVYVMGDSLEKAMRDMERDGKKYRDADGVSLFKNLHATASFTRSRNWSNSPAPGLNARMPRMQWNYPPAGYPYPPRGQGQQYPPPPAYPYPAPPR